MCLLACFACKAIRLYYCARPCLYLSYLGRRPSLALRCAWRAAHILSELLAQPSSLCDMVSTLADAAMAAPPPNPDDAVVAPYTFVACLLLPAVWGDREEFPLQPFLYL